ncbi:MAG: phosphoribosylanthranilate isomerase [Polyangiaceae bacterium]
MTVHVKICGVTSVADALACVDAGASSIGLNFIPSSPRCVSAETARAISKSIGARALVVGVVADLTVDAMRALKDEAELGCLQLHGEEPPEVVAALLPHAYKALRISNEWDVARAGLYPGEYVLVDAKVEGALGGTGKTFDWDLVRDLARARKLTLAGGLTPENVVAAVRAVRPFAVDVASGVEAESPRKKDVSRVRAFVLAAHSI